MSNDSPDDLADRVRALETTVERLVEVLVGREVLTEGHKRLFAKITERAARSEKPVVQLRAFSGDKYEVEGPDIDCASLMHLCRGRCCSLNVKLTRQDVDEGLLSWDVEKPYMLEKAADGYCGYLGDGGGCTQYKIRPATCREFDCREDSRIWFDFEKKIPAPYGVVREYPEPEDK